MYFFPIAAITNTHKFSGLKQRRFIILYFCRSKVWNGSHWVKMQVLAGLYSEGSRTDLFSCIFPASRHCPYSLAYRPLPSSKPAMASLIFLPSLWFWLFCLPHLHVRPSWLHWTHLDNAGYSPCPGLSSREGPGAHWEPPMGQEWGNSVSWAGWWLHRWVYFTIIQQTIYLWFVHFSLYMS